MSGLQRQCLAYINAIIEANFQKFKHNRLQHGINVQIYVCLYSLCLFEESSVS